ncbi:MAG: DUF1295 domain-containing protein, partial [Thermoguttaceae bacterium]|nr:DUF1295 domain-containing protein [Thermoguttaceae bacterium]
MSGRPSPLRQRELGRSNRSITRRTINVLLNPGLQVLLGLLFVSGLMAGLWQVQRKTGNAGIVDAGWAAAIGMLGIFFAATSDGYPPRRLLVAMLIGIWSARLALYILLDRVVGHAEEGRYRTLREK